MAQQITIGVSIEDLERAAPQDDTGMRLLRGILGDDFAESPLTAIGNATSLFGDLFFIFNSIAFVIGSTFLGYRIVAAIAESAAEGEALGKGGSDVYAPVRIGFGIFGMLPLFSGFSLAQAVLMAAVTLGIGGANMMVSTALKSSADMKAIVPSYSLAASEPTLSSDVTGAVRGLFLAELCRQDADKAYKEIGTMRPRLQRTQLVDHAGRYGWDFRSCGSVIMTQRENYSPREDSSWNSFRVASVNYKAISDAARQAGRNTLTTIRLRTYSIVSDYVAEHAASTSPEVDADAASMAQARLEALEKEARIALSSELKSAAQGAGDAVQQEVSEKIREQGWVALRAYYSTFAEVGSAIADAQKAWTYSFAAGDSAKSLEQLRKRNMPQLTQFLLVAERSEETQSDEGFFARVIQSVVPERNATGNLSYGQAALNAMTGWVAEGSGGAGLVNPVLAAKNLGDWLMTVGQTGVLAGLAGSAASNLNVGAFVAKVAAGASGAGRVLDTVFWIQIAAGTFLSVVVPLQVFMTWVTALGVYIASIIEALVGAQIAALSHIKMRGNGFAEGGAAKYYKYLAIMLFKPPLMVIGFFAGSAMMVVMGSLLIALFAQAVASAQGNSLTGPLTITAFILVFGFMLVGIVQTSANLILDLPNRVLPWLGEATEHFGGAIAGAAAGAAMTKLRGPSPMMAADAAKKAASPTKPK